MKCPYSTDLGEVLYKYQGSALSTPATAEISRDFLPKGKYAKLVQEALDTCADEVRRNPQHFDWRDRRVMDFTLDLEDDGRQIERYVVPVAPGDRVLFGRYRFHKARSPQESPFVQGRSRPVLAPSLTIELTRAHGRMMLVRAYGGEYIPPLPWQASAGNYEGGLARSRDFWLNHAFVMAPCIRPQGKLNSRPPKWAREPVGQH